MLDPGSAGPAEHPLAGAGPLFELCAAAVTSLPVTGASVTVTTSGGVNVLLHSTDAVAARLSDLEADLGEGPGIDAMAQRQPVTVADLADLDTAPDDVRGRWLAFAPASVAAGARAVLAFPLRLGAAQLGVLVLYRDRALRLSSEQQVRALVLADAMFYAVLDVLSAALPTADGGGSGTASDDAVMGSGIALHRSEVYQAAGMVMAQLDVGIAEATVRLHGYAYAAERPVVEVARDIVARRLRLIDDNGAIGQGGTK